MARPRQVKKADGLTSDQIHYLAGLYESSLGLRGVGTNGAVGISNTEDWPKYMAETYGGTHRQFTSGKTEKTFWGWYVPIRRRLELGNELFEAGALRAIEAIQFDGIKFKQERAINSGRGDEGA
jgi:hypothetical protein